MPTTGKEETDMYPKRSNNKPILITVGVMAAVAAALIAANVIVKKPKKPAETEAQKHSVLIYKSSDGSIEYQLSGDRTVFVPLKDAVLPGNAAGVRNIGAALFRDHSYTVTNLQTGIFQSLAGPVVMAIMKEAADGRTAPKQTVATREVSKTQTESKVGKGWEGPTSALEGLSNALGRGKTDIPSPFEKTR